MKSICMGLVGLAAGLATACSRSAEVESASPGSVQEAQVTGRVRQVGAAPAVRTLIQAEQEVVQVTGVYEPELARVVGARVRVTGVRRPGDLEPVLEATGYELLSVDGEAPFVGLLAHDSGRWTVTSDEGAVLEITAVSERLAAARGAKVWIVAGPDGRSVARYGILRHAEEMEP